MKHESRYHFERHTIRERSVLVACWAVLFAFGVASALAPVSHDPSTVHATGIAIACATGFLLVRSVRWATIDIYEDSVVLRGLIRTTKLDRARIDRFLVVPGLDFRAAPAVALAVKSTAGETRVFNDFASALDARSFSADSLALELNSWLGKTLAVSVQFEGVSGQISPEDPMLIRPGCRLSSDLRRETRPMRDLREDVQSRRWRPPPT